MQLRDKSSDCAHTYARLQFGGTIMATIDVSDALPTEAATMNATLSALRYQYREIILTAAETFGGDCTSVDDRRPRVRKC